MTSLDAALSELGLLSSVPDARRQYVRECAARMAARNIQAGRERLNSEPSSTSANVISLSQGSQDGNMRPYRERKNSEPPCTTQITITPPAPTSFTPNNSPSKGLQVLHINPAFVTNLMLSPDAAASSRYKPPDYFGGGGARSRVVVPTVVDKHCLMPPSTGEQQHRFGGDQENRGGDMVYRRVKLSRHAKRFRKPYELPWLQRRVSELSNMHMTSSSQMGGGGQGYLNPSGISAKTDSSCSIGGAGDVLYSNRSMFDDSSTTNSQLQSRSQLQSNEQCHIQAQVHHVSPCDMKKKTEMALPSDLLFHSVPRSKSLDNLDFAKLQLAEQENQNYLIERREIDNVSQHMQNLNVSE